MAPKNNDSFRLYLQDLFLERRAKNPKYSLRAYAQSLALNHSSLSQILRQKRVVSSKTQHKICNALNLSPLERKKFNIDGNPKNRSFKKLSLEHFAVISEWYHDAILELFKCHDFCANPKWIAERLDIHVNEAQFALERLERVGLLGKNSDKQLRLQDFSTSALGNELTTVAQRKYQHQVLDRAIEAICNIPKSLREQCSMTMAIQLSDLPKIKKMIKNFQRKTCVFAQRPQVKADQVYQLAISFYPHTQISKEYNK